MKTLLKRCRQNFTPNRCICKNITSVIRRLLQLSNSIFFQILLQRMVQNDVIKNNRTIQHLSLSKFINILQRMKL